MIGSLTKPRPVGLLIVFVLIATIGSAVFVYSSYQSNREQAIVDDWQSVKATITNREVKILASGARGPVNFLAIIAYRYEVDGKTYDGDVFNIAERWATFPQKSDAQKFLNESTRADEVEVFYDPQIPSRSVFSRTPVKDYKVRMGLGSLGFLIGGTICLAYIRRPDDYD